MHSSRMILAMPQAFPPGKFSISLAMWCDEMSFPLASRTVFFYPKNQQSIYSIISQLSTRCPKPSHLSVMGTRWHHVKTTAVRWEFRVGDTLCKIQLLDDVRWMDAVTGTTDLSYTTTCWMWRWVGGATINSLEQQVLLGLSAEAKSMRRSKSMAYGLTSSSTRLLWCFMLDKISKFEHLMSVKIRRRLV